MSDPLRASELIGTETRSDIIHSYKNISDQTYNKNMCDQSYICNKNMCDQSYMCNKNMCDSRSSPICSVSSEKYTNIEELGIFIDKDMIPIHEKIIDENRIKKTISLDESNISLNPSTCNYEYLQNNISSYNYLLKNTIHTNNTSYKQYRSLIDTDVSIQKTNIIDVSYENTNLIDNIDGDTPLFSLTRPIKMSHVENQYNDLYINNVKSIQNQYYSNDTINNIDSCSLMSENPLRASELGISDGSLLCYKNDINNISLVKFLSSRISINESPICALNKYIPIGIQNTHESNTSIIKDLNSGISNKVYEKNNKVYEKNNKVYEKNNKVYEKNNIVYEKNNKVYEKNNKVYEKNNNISKEYEEDTLNNTNNNKLDIIDNIINENNIIKEDIIYNNKSNNKHIIKESIHVLSEDESPLCSFRNDKDNFPKKRPLNESIKYDKSHINKIHINNKNMKLS
eukprot:GHVL01043792.1.p1 GENE.GHVL01043792.1~~GHVL01043792.1.p1  ORF type:complete len:534 (-),score=161.18 GHVL01043792.1:1002-2369(-)